MSELQLGLLAPALGPLVDKFYRAHRSPMRAPSGAQVWVARRQDILAALCLTPMDAGHWLTGLLAAPTARRQGLASRLIEQALRHTPGPVWLFCHPQLVGFYQRLGFVQIRHLPPSLSERLARYQRSKPLVAMAHGSTTAAAPA